MRSGSEKYLLATFKNKNCNHCSTSGTCSLSESTLLVPPAAAALDNTLSGTGVYLKHIVKHKVTVAQIGLKLNLVKSLNNRGKKMIL